MIVGIYGGSFDPIHTGHSIVANFMSQCNEVDEVWLMVNRKNPLKSHGVFASDEDRLAMASLVAKKCRNVKVCDIEMKLPTPSFTYDALCELKRIFPQHSFKLIIGSDSLENFNNWKESDKIIREFGLLVYPRPGYPLKGEEPSGIVYINGAPEFSISSSLIREYIKSGWNINFFVAPAVSEYIATHKLYR